MWLKNRPIAHRGLWTDGVPENSFLAFENAIVNNYPIELDVQMTSDGELIIFHDWKIDRMTNAHGKISQLSSEEVGELCLKNTKQKIPFLKDFLRFIDGRVPLLIEMKYQGYKKNLYIEKLFYELDSYSGEFALSSFNPSLVKKAKKKFDKILCGQNFTDYKKYSFVSGWVRKNSMYVLWKVSSHMPDFFVCRASMLPKCWVRDISRRKEKFFLVWGIESADEYSEKKDLVDNYIFDYENIASFK